MVLSLETFQIKTMIGGLVDTVRPLVEKNRNTLTVRGADEVRPMHADLTKTRQILLNLLSNASKFTHDGTITVDIRECTIDGADAVEFSVTDTGVGMTARTDAEGLRPVHAGRRDDDAQIRRHRPRAGHRLALLRSDGRQRLGREPSGRRVAVRRAAAARDDGRRHRVDGASRRAEYEQLAGTTESNGDDPGRGRQRGEP